MNIHHPTTRVPGICSQSEEAQVVKKTPDERIGEHCDAEARTICTNPDVTVEWNHLSLVIRYAADPARFTSGDYESFVRGLVTATYFLAEVDHDVLRDAIERTKVIADLAYRTA